ALLEGFNGRLPYRMALLSNSRLPVTICPPTGARHHVSFRGTLRFDASLFKLVNGHCQVVRGHRAVTRRARAHPLRLDLGPGWHRCRLTEKIVCPSEAAGLA